MDCRVLFCLSLSIIIVLLCGSCVFADFKPGDMDLPEVVVPLLEYSPAVKENTSSPGWNKAAKIFGFVNTANGMPASQDTEVWLGRDSEALYVAFVCHMPAGVKPLARQAGRDVAIWQDDSVELYIAPAKPKDDKDYWQFCVSASGATWDGRGASQDWNGQWESSAVIEDGKWSACLKIPFATLGFTEVPDLLKFAPTRTIIAPEPELTVLVHVSPTSYFTGTKSMGLMKFGPNLPAVALSAGSNFSDGDVVIKADALVLPEQKYADSALTVLGLDGKVVKVDTQQQRFDSLSVIHTISNIPDGLYKLRYTYGDPVKVVPTAVYGGSGEIPNDPEAVSKREKIRSVLLEWPLEVRATVAVGATITLKDYGRRLVAALATSGKLDDRGDPRFDISLETVDGAKLADLGSVPLERNSKDAVFESQLPELEELTYYRLRVVLREGETMIAENAISFATPARPEWLGTKEGLTDGRLDGVPEPWTPVLLQGRSVSVWGRQYRFDRGPVPNSAISQGRELLASPCEIVLDPSPKSWKLIRSYAEGAGPTAAVFEWESVGSDVIYHARTEVGFDGAIRVDVTVPAGAAVGKMALEMPCAREHARYIHRGPLSWGGMNSAYELPKEKETYSSSRAVNTGAFYFLDDWVGMGWMDGMPFAPPLNIPERGMEMIPGDDAALLRVNYIDNPKVYDVDRTYTFGLLAVPVKPYPEDLRDLRWYYSYMYGDEDPENNPAWLSTAEYDSDGNVDLSQGTAEIWFKPDFDPATHQRVEKFLEVGHGQHYQFVLRWEPADGICVRSIVWGRAIGAASNIHVPKGEWAHVASTWDDNSIKLYINGEMVAETEANLRSHMGVDPVSIYAGGQNVFVDGLRISARSRSAFDISSQPVPDADTLLCDNFDNVSWVNGRKAFIPEKSDSRTEGGYFSPDMTHEPGKWGMGIGPMRVPVKSKVEGLGYIGMKQAIIMGQYFDRCFAGLHVEHEDKLKSAIKAHHDAGMKVVLYLSNSLSTYDPMWYTYADDWLIEPRGIPFRPPHRPDEEGYQACPRGGYHEYWYYRLGRLADEYGVDGFYLDGRLYSTCSNSKHGCGTTDFDGKPVAAADIWDGREKSWRMLNVIRGRGGQWYQHDSGLRDAPSFYFADFLWDGEQLMGTNLGDRKRLEALPLTPFRVLMDGRKFGTPTANAAYSYQPLMPIDYCTYSFVHGTTWVPTYNRMNEPMTLAPFWKAQDEFGATFKNFIGYWYDSPPAVSTPNDLVKVSAHAENGRALVIVANFNEVPVRGKVKLNLKSLGLTSPSVRDAFSKEPVELVDGDSIQIDIRGFRQSWYLLEG